MRLYKMELYKICHRKLFTIGAVCAAALTFLFFLVLVSGEETYVNGITYQGYRAVQADREITEEFRGLLTDEKAEKIIETYGFPQRVEKYEAYYRDANFLNGYVEKYLSDGYYRRYDDYVPASSVYPLAESEVGKAAAVLGKEVVMEYSRGWTAFFDILVIGLVIGSIVIIFSISIVFANESQSKMLQLLFTTKEGKRTDIYAKIAAAYTVSLGVWSGVVILDFLLCGMVYGFDGLDCMIGTTEAMGISLYRPLSMLSVGVFLVITLFRSLLGVLLLCSVTIYISARFQSCFHAVVNAALCWMAPVLMWFLIGIFKGGLIIRIIRSIILCLIHASPVYLVRFDSIMDCYRSWRALALLSAAGIIFYTVRAYREYKRKGL